MIPVIGAISGGQGGITGRADSGAQQRSADYFGGMQNRVEGIDLNQTDTQSVLIAAAAAVAIAWLLTR